MSFTHRVPVLFLLALLTAGSLGGCATYEAKEIDDRGVETLATRFQWPLGDTIFRVMARLPEDQEDVEAHYGVNLLDADILPVQVFVQNASDHSDFLLGEFAFELPAARRGVKLRKISAEDVQARVAFSQWRSFVGYLFAIIPGIFSSMDIAEANRAMRRDYEEKELASDLYLAEGTRTIQSGTIFFTTDPPDVPLSESGYERGTLRVSVTRIPQGDSPPDLATEFEAEVELGRR